LYVEKEAAFTMSYHEINASPGVDLDGEILKFYKSVEDIELYTKAIVKFDTNNEQINKKLNWKKYTCTSCANMVKVALISLGSDQNILTNSAKSVRNDIFCIIKMPHHENIWHVIVLYIRDKFLKIPNGIMQLRDHTVRLLFTGFGDENTKRSHELTLSMSINGDNNIIRKYYIDNDIVNIVSVRYAEGLKLIVWDAYMDPQEPKLNMIITHTSNNNNLDVNWMTLAADILSKMNWKKVNDRCEVTFNTVLITPNQYK
jgi:hypothetical protein